MTCIIERYYQWLLKQVIGVPDERLGEQVAAWIRLKAGQSATKQEILDFCKGQVINTSTCSVWQMSTVYTK
jgi:acyl-CoA synthetase (AMP-forming)/AMP-acid ligase II